jgi:hypothetical protein
MLNKNNLGLIATLYSNHNANLYSDIYFPIINYSIATITKSQNGIEQYYDVEFLQETISKEFGIKIPLIVLKQAINALVSQNKDIKIRLFSKGEKFLIEKEWDLYTDNSIEERLSSVLLNYDELEDSFQKYLEENSVTSDKSFLEFFSDNTDDILKYLDNLEAIPNVNENYYHLVNFLIQIKKKNYRLFKLANTTFWASVISAFLKRDVDLKIKPEKQVQYYLDSSLVLGVLDLDSELNTIYGEELVSAITAAGHKPCIHPLTIKEIDGILQSVEKSGPHPGSAIEEAYYRRNLNAVSMLQIRNSLAQLLKKSNIQILENNSPNELDDIGKSYKNKPKVKSLKGRRGFSNGGIRDVHDIFMCDFIIKRRGNVQNIEKTNSSFVTLNTDLIVFVKKEYSHTISPTLHPSNVISDLWLHDPKCTLTKDNGLTIMMSRCISLNNTDVRRKLGQLAKFVDTDSITEDDYTAIYNSLVNRSKSILNKIGDLKNESKEESKSIVVDIIEVSKKEEQNRLKKIHALENKTDEIIKNNEKLTIDLELFKKTIENNKKHQTDVEKNSKEKDEEINKLKTERPTATRLNKRLKDIDSSMSKMEKDKDANTSMNKYWMLLVPEIIAIALFLFSIIMYISNINCQSYLSFFNTQKGYLSIFTFAIALLVFLYKAKESVVLSPKLKYQAILEEQESYWLKKNEIYSKLLIEKEKIILELKSLEEV